MTSFIFVRHGRTADNAKGNIVAAAATLTRQGQAEARKAARALKKLDIAVVASSPLARAKETADIIAKELGIKAVHVVPELTERGYGALEGKPRTEPLEWYFVGAGPQTEPPADVLLRAQTALQKIQEHAKEGSVAVVGHAVSGYYLQQAAAGTTRVQDFAPITKLDNGAFITITPQPKPRRVFPWQMVSATAGLALLLVGLGWLGAASLTPTPETSVKQQTIQLSPDDYSGDPNLQNAITKQLQQQSSSDASSSPQAQQQDAPSTTNAQINPLQASQSAAQALNQ